MMRGQRHARCGQALQANLLVLLHGLLFTACCLSGAEQYAKIIQKVGYHSARFTEFKIQVCSL
jgi:hypothetical protein